SRPDGDGQASISMSVTGLIRVRTCLRVCRRACAREQGVQSQGAGLAQRLPDCAGRLRVALQRGVVVRN
ncbi:MAG: hypothetical protein ACK4YX_06900, partial [Rhabdaerophilum calidifontis]